MKLFSGFNTKVLICLIFSFIFFGCRQANNSGTFQVSFFLEGSPFPGSTFDVKSGYKIPVTNRTVAAHAGGRGLYKGTVNDIDRFWTVLSGPGAGEIWDFNDPVTADMMLMAEAGDAPEKEPIGGKGKTFYDNVMNYINDRRNSGSYIMALGEDCGEREDIPAGIKNKEVKKVTFSPGVNLTIIGIGGERTIHVKGSRVLVLPGDAEGPISLTLGKNVTIRGSEADSSNGMIRVGNGQTGNMEITFTMLPGSKITGYETDRSGSGVGSGAVVVSGSETKRGSKITFYMKGGEITGNCNLRKGGQNSAGVTLNRANMIMEGDAKITGNTGFGGDIAYGFNSDYPMPDNLFVEIKDNAEIGELFLYASVSSPGSGYQSPHIKIHDGWNGNIDKLNLGFYEVDGKTAPVMPNYWEDNACVRNASESGSAIGTINSFVAKITLGYIFQWNSGQTWPDALNGYRINISNGRITK